MHTGGAAFSTAARAQAATAAFLFSNAGATAAAAAVYVAASTGTVCRPNAHAMSSAIVNLRLSTLSSLQHRYWVDGIGL
jgi:hypothetical protein